MNVGDPVSTIERLLMSERSPFYSAAPLASRGIVGSSLKFRDGLLCLLLTVTIEALAGILYKNTCMYIYI